MNFNRLIAVSAILFVTASFAQARQQPNPPPSGIVVHLFGPNSIMSNVMPDLPGEIVKPSPATPGQPGASAQPTAPGQPGAPAETAGAGTPQATQTDYPEPSWGDVLHQMFIVGDPNNPPKPAPGRPADQPQGGQ